MEPIIKAIEAFGGSQTEFAAALGVTKGAVTNWIAGTARVDPKNCRAIEALTDGAVTAADIRPDVFGDVELLKTA